MIHNIFKKLGLLISGLFKTTKNFLKLIILIALSLILVFAAFNLYEYAVHGYRYTSDVQCVDKSLASEHHVDEIIYKFETGSSEILFYYPKEKKMHVALLEKKMTNKGLRYSHKNTYELNKDEIFGDDYDINDCELARLNNIRYTFFKNKSDLEHFDINKDNMTLVELENIREDGTVEKFWDCFVVDD